MAGTTALGSLRAYDRIVEAEASTPRPFIYRITETGLIKPVPIPMIGCVIYTIATRLDKIKNLRVTVQAGIIDQLLY